MIIIIGIKISAKQSGVSAWASTAVMTAVTGGASLAMGASGMKGIAQRGGEKVKDAATKVGEKAGWVNQGTTKLNQQNRLKEVSQGLEAKYENNAEGNAELAKYATGRAFTSAQKKRKAASGEILAKRDAMGAIEESKREGVARYSTASGADKNTFTKVDPSLSFKTDRQKNKEATQLLREEEKVRLEKRGYTPTEVDAKAKAFKPSEASLSAKKSEMAKAKAQENKLGFKAVTDADAENRIRSEYTPTKTEINNLVQNGYNTSTGQHMSFKNESEAKKFLQAQMPKPTASQIASAKETMTKEKVMEKAIGFTPATENDGRQRLINQELESTGLTGKAADDHLKKYLAGIGDAEIRTAMGGLNQERKSKAYSKLSVSEIRNLPKEALSDMDFIKNISAGKIEKAATEMSQEQVNEMKTMIPKIRESIRSKLGLSATASNADVKAARALASKDVQKELHKMYDQLNVLKTI